MCMNPNWNGLMQVIEATKLSKNGEVIWRQNNVPNILHTEGEEFVLKVVFTDLIKPINYYMGLDNRTTLNASDTMQTIVDSTTEPAVNGYTRQQMSSSEEFTVGLLDGVNIATGPIVVFPASGGSWGPVQNIFLTTAADDNGFLMSSVRLSEEATVDDGESIALRIGFKLRDCPV